MKYTQIQLAGDRARATLTPAATVGTVRISLALPGGGGEEREADIANPQARWEAAEWLQRSLEGYRGCGGDIREYAAALDLAAGV